MSPSRQSRGQASRDARRSRERERRKAETQDATNRCNTSRRQVAWSALTLRQGCLRLVCRCDLSHKIQTDLNLCDRSQRQNSVAATMIFTCHTRRFVTVTCRGDESQRFVASCVSVLKSRGEIFRPGKNYCNGLLESLRAVTL